MGTIYLDNFRGFNKTYIHLKDINFLVGENSTGKTSFLRVVQLFSSFQFWFQTDFNVDNVNLGTYDDLANSKYSDHFSLGYYQDHFGEDTEESKASVYAFLLTFKAKEGVPHLTSFCYLDKRYSVQASRKQSQIWYVVEPLSDYNINDIVPKHFFSQWVSQASSLLTDYKIIKIPNPFRETLTPFFISTLIHNELNNQSRKDRGRVGPPSFLDVDEFRGMKSLAPVRVKPQRTYDAFKLDFSPEGEHTPYLLNRFLHSERERKQYETLIQILNDFGQASGLYDKIEIRRFGRDKFAPFMIGICLNDETYKITNVGYGVSQSLPIVTEIMSSREKTWFAIQQPEVHLHPRAQAAVGELIYEIYKSTGSKFIIETHSDFVIDRFRLKIRSQRLNSDVNEQAGKIQVIFFERTEVGNVAHHLVLDENGDYPLEQPEAFREFFLKEQMSLLGL